VSHYKDEKGITDKNKTEDVIQDVTVNKMSEQLVGESNEIENKETKDDQKVVSSWKRKMIGALSGKKIEGEAPKYVMFTKYSTCSIK